MRGKPLISHLGKHAKRIIPADAGKTVCTTTHTPVQWDHPRRCGENKTTLRQCSYRLRIIPAGAGKTRENRRNPAQAAGSPPQVRGKRNLQTCHHMIGSPPQVRGKHDTTVPAVRQYRITPAGAGKTRHGRTDSGCHRDHPRGCGENHKLTVMCSDGKGSPPQVRGKHRHSLPRKAEHKDHPRRCGENISAVRLIASLQGSPPQVRGKLYGDTLWSIARRDHPRRCGENYRGFTP